MDFLFYYRSLAPPVIKLQLFKKKSFQDGCVFRYYRHTVLNLLYNYDNIICYNKTFYNMKTVKSYTLGCKVNQYESRYLLEGLYQLGYQDAEEGATPDVCVVNTCTVTSDSDGKSRHLIRKLMRDYPNARLLVMGCWATRNLDLAQELCDQAGNGSEVIDDKAKLGDWLYKEGCACPPIGIHRFAGRTRAFVKVQDGCRQRCSYCAIPTVRSRLSSRSPEEVCQEVAVLVKNGYREIVLTGIHMGFYGEGLPTLSTGQRPRELPDLVEALVCLSGDFRLRISSLESHEVSPRLLDLMEQFPEKLCPHLHVSMQSGSTPILKSMNRPSTAEQYYDFCHQAQVRIPDIALTTDVIVGFPGETEQYFQETLDLVERIGFSKVHIFRYSQRERTPAAGFPNQIRPEIKQERLERLNELSQRLRERYFMAQTGKTVRVLIENHNNGTLAGTTERYIPVQFPGSELLVNQFVELTLQKENLIPGGSIETN